MRIALLGNGKTGSEFAAIASVDPKNHLTVFNTKNTVTLEELRKHDVVVSFLPGDAFSGHIPLLVASGLPVVCGSTGFAFPGGKKSFSELLSSHGITWIYASNFSLGMQIMHEILPLIGRMSEILLSADVRINEVHHTEKKDAPSGTALSWLDWLGIPAEISSERTGDVVGEHELSIETDSELIKVHHSAKNRRLFAQGALKAAEWILDAEMLPEAGLHPFSQVIRNQLSTQRINVS